MTDFTHKIEALLNTSCYLIDIFPSTVPQKKDGRYFEVEACFLKERRTLDEKFRRFLLKLYCYYDFWLYLDGGCAAGPEPRQVIKILQNCFDRKGEQIYFYLPASDSLIGVDGDTLYLTLYHPDQKLKELVSCLVQAEGLFFYPAP